ncbi:hypothetical protein DFS34DRAFT_103923 [Phlyctochytrium arcticum]|nr:hypothetical protein DFS34DRAFT_103923 [Phlyctochytrium arcticum]
MKTPEFSELIEVMRTKKSRVILNKQILRWRDRSTRISSEDPTSQISARKRRQALEKDASTSEWVEKHTDLLPSALVTPQKTHQHEKSFSDDEFEESSFLQPHDISRLRVNVGDTTVKVVGGVDLAAIVRDVQSNLLKGFIQKEDTATVAEDLARSGNGSRESLHHSLR